VPLIGPLLALVAGILAAPQLDLRYAGVAVLLAFLLAWRHRRFGLAVFGLLGAFVAQRAAPAGVNAVVDDGLARRILLRLDAAPEAGADGISLEARVLAADGITVDKGRALIRWFPEDDAAVALFESLDLGRGDTLEALVRLRRPNVYRDPGVFDYRRFLARQGIYWTGTLRSPRLVSVLDRGWHAPDRIREWTAERIGQYFETPTTRALILGMVLGRRNLLPRTVETKFEEAGLIHLLVVSGFNLAVVAGAAFFLGSMLFSHAHAREVFTLTLILGYAFLVGNDPPVLRATIMAVWLVLGRMLDRGYSPANALAGTAMLILLVDPTAIRDTSFLLSFGAVTAILSIGAPWVAWTHSRLHPALQRLAFPETDGHLPDVAVDLRVALRIRAELSGWPLECLALPVRFVSLVGEVTLVTMGIQILLLPFAIESFHRVAPVSVPLNVLGAAIASMVTPPGLLLIFLPRPVGSALAWVLALLLDGLMAALDIALRLPAATLRVPSPPLLLWIGFTLGLLILRFALARRSAKTARAAGAGLGGILLVMLFGDFSPEAPPNPVVTVLDVGQGDSILIEVPDGQRIVVDGGGIVSSDIEEGGFRIGEDVVSAYLFSRRFRRIDTLVLTHAHQDHMDGLFDLVRNFEIGEVWLGPNPMVPRYREFLESLAIRGIPLRHVRTGDEPGPFRVLNPGRTRRVSHEVSNDDSVVLLFDWKGRRALLTGDLERTLDDPALDEGGVDLLKVPHHGSRGSRLEVAARVPVISVGANNRFGHPDASRLPALRTDLLGAIEVTLAPDGPRVAFPGLASR
jgi:competence protein ComEC